MTEYLLKDNQGFAESISHRTILKNVPYLLPILDGLPEDFVLLDAGCGPASITLDIARRYPSAMILGVDCSTSVIDKARRLAEDEGLSNVRFAVGDVLDMAAIASQPGFEAVVGGCDVVQTHYVHMHVKDAKLLMGQLFAAAKVPGGVVCCREPDPWSLDQHPATKGVLEVVGTALRMMEARGQNPRAALQFFSHALAAGFKRGDITIEADVWEVATLPDRRDIMNTLVFSLEKLFLTEEAASMLSSSFAEILEEAEAWVQNDNAYMRIPCRQMVARRR